MKHALICLYLLMPTLLFAQNRVDGNGTITSQTRPLAQFSSVSLDFVAEVQIRTGAAPGIEITVDDNILPHIGTQVRAGKLLITQERWIEPSQTALIHITTPHLAFLETSGYSTVRVLEATGPSLSLNAGVGTVEILSGKVDNLNVRTKQGTVDASRLTAEAAQVAVTGRGIVKVNVTGKLDVDAPDDAVVVVTGEPIVAGRPPTPPAVASEIEQREVDRITIRIKNNRLWWSNLRVEGPTGARFGYGFNLGPRVARTETWPIGTRVYRVSGDEERLLYTVARADSGKVVPLFDQ